MLKENSKEGICMFEILSKENPFTIHNQIYFINQISVYPFSITHISENAGSSVPTSLLSSANRIFLFSDDLATTVIGTGLLVYCETLG